ncbi:hypothetical protein ACFWJM_05275 [Streptomyces sp. NPDC127077]|uniref:hypothetical protein n=1 Tax=Streptomyces sp. NPDC127077 TaxID=3347131 RepID=UPI003663D863
MVIEAGVVAGYVIAWAVGKARRAAGRLDAETDAMMDAGLDRLHTVVTAKLGAHPALDHLAAEAAADDGQISDLTRKQVESAVTDAAHEDDEFAQEITELGVELGAAKRDGGVSVVAGAGSTVFTGDSHPRASGDGINIAFGQVGGTVSLDGVAADGQRPDPPEPGRSRH